MSNEIRTFLCTKNGRSPKTSKLNIHLPFPKISSRSLRRRTSGIFIWYLTVFTLYCWKSVVLNLTYFVFNRLTIVWDWHDRTTMKIGNLIQITDLGGFTSDLFTLSANVMIRISSEVVSFFGPEILWQLICKFCVKISVDSDQKMHRLKFDKRSHENVLITIIVPLREEAVHRTSSEI